MKQKEKNLVILAAGIGSRFKNGIKQLQPVGPSGECIMEYSIYDALEAGFNRIVFIIRKDIEALFDDMIGNRIRGACAPRGVEVVCAYQDKHNLPGDFQCPEERIKPWGTGHALLSCKGLLRGGFVVINADDYYGKEAYVKMAQFLDGLEPGGARYALAGFPLENTLSENGGVTRGLCQRDEAGMLTRIRETKQVRKSQEGPWVKRDDAVEYLDGKTPVSMNMWAFTPDVLDRMEMHFERFLSNELNTRDSEFLIPDFIAEALEEGVSVRVIDVDGKWFGMTYSADAPVVTDALKQMTNQGLYSCPLF